MCMCACCFQSHGSGSFLWRDYKGRCRTCSWQSSPWKYPYPLSCSRSRPLLRRETLPTLSRDTWSRLGKHKMQKQSASITLLRWHFFQECKMPLLWWGCRQLAGIWDGGMLTYWEILRRQTDFQPDLLITGESCRHQPNHMSHWPPDDFWRGPLLARSVWHRRRQWLHGLHNCSTIRYPDLNCVAPHDAPGKVDILTCIDMNTLT